MPAVLDRPTVLDRPSIDNLYNLDSDQQKMWNLLLFKSDMFREDIETILLKIFPFNKTKLDHIFDELRAHKVALLWVDTKERVSAYHDILAAAQLRVCIEPEG
jgi:hypothetical protein